MLTLIRCPFHPCVSAVTRTKVSSKHTLYTFDPAKSEWVDYAVVQAECGNLSGHELTRNSSGNTWSQSSQLAEPLKTDLAIKNRISVRELISTLKKKKAQTGMNGRTFSQNPCKRGKSHHVKQGLMQTLF